MYWQASWSGQSRTYKLFTNTCTVSDYREMTLISRWYNTAQRFDKMWRVRRVFTITAIWDTANRYLIVRTRWVEPTFLLAIFTVYVRKEEGLVTDWILTSRQPHRVDETWERRRGRRSRRRRRGRRREGRKKERSNDFPRKRKKEKETKKEVTMFRHYLSMSQDLDHLQEIKRRKHIQSTRV